MWEEALAEGPGAAPVAALLEARRHHRFVGRREEVALFEAAVSRDRWPFQVLHVSGPGGIGKTELLREYRRLARQAGLDVVWLDGREAGGDPDALASWIAAGLRAASGGSARCVLFLDDADAVECSERTLREDVLARLPASCLAVLASRREPSVGWRADGGWIGLLRELRLEPLDADAVRDYLARRGLPAERLDEILAFTRGHPLSLTLACDACEREPEAPLLSGRLPPHLLESVLDLVLPDVRTPEHRRALEVAAVLRRTRENLLAELLDLDEAHEPFRWLRAQSFVDTTPEGLELQSIVRATVAADLRWRNPTRYDALRERARRRCLAKIASADAREQDAALLDYLFLSSEPEEWLEDAKLVRLAELAVEPAGPADGAELARVVEGCQGATAAARARKALVDGGASTVRVVRRNGRIVGVLLSVPLDPARTDAVDAPGIAGMLAHLRAGEVLRPGEHAVLHLPWYDPAAPHPGSIRCALLLDVLRAALRAPSLAVSFVGFCDGCDWEIGIDRAGAQRLEALDFKGGRHLCEVWACDWRRFPPSGWLDRLVRGELDGRAPDTDVTPPPREVLGRTELVEAVREALRELGNPDALRRSPLVSSRAVLARAPVDAGPTERVGALRELLVEAVEGLRGTPRRDKMYRALHRTYVEPAPTQERAADMLGLPLSTYRRHLEAGVEKVAAALWQLELEGGQ